MESTDFNDDAERDEQSYAIIGGAMEVHCELGCGFLEPLYQEALAIEFESKDIPFEKEKLIEIRYKETILDCTYRADFICFDTLLVEIKAVENLAALHRSQVINYLNATGFSRALLINFGARSLQYERFGNFAGKSRK